MKAIFAFLFLILISFKGFSQFELPKKTLNIAPISNPKGSVSPTSSKAITYPSIFDKKDKLGESFSLLKKKPEEEKSIFEKEQFASPAKGYTEKANKMLKTEGYASVVENSDFFFGEFKVYTETIYIGCRDYGNVDGDLIAIYLNGEKVIPLYELESGFNKYTFNLKLGLNTIQIEALNTGEFFPNTGAFTFFDGNEKLITAQQWGLNTGYKAVVKIFRINGIELEVKK
ncbi:hypothetical protein QWY90_11060 [Flavobacterium paronense]|uniref:Uncharacterized protein n=1 Tax=Flavobacterium paronense TaxID=1392775 RepID=A0ABV5GC86_9FLAO|nr:hypothetical protein [Flavobacterium paronense]MDN3677847.1 hypothetical protein [Flavobacterium paronense]